MTRCTCGKVIYETETLATLACVKEALLGRLRIQYYSRRCGCYHLTSGVRRPGKRPGHGGSRGSYHGQKDKLRPFLKEAP